MTKGKGMLEEKNESEVLDWFLSGLSMLEEVMK